MPHPHLYGDYIFYLHWARIRRRSLDRFCATSFFAITTVEAQIIPRIGTPPSKRAARDRWNDGYVRACLPKP